jgi:hypothetical protein
MAAAGISVLTAGAVTGSLLTGSAHAELTAVAAPVVVSSGSALSAADLGGAREADNRRLERTTRSNQRLALSTATAASVVREKALTAEHRAAVEREKALEKKKAAEEKKRKAEAKKKKAEAKAKAEKKKRARAAEKRRGYRSGDSPKSIARSIMKNKFGWGGSEFSCYNKIIMRESAWNIHADNPTSSAYGIPQALPGSKMASAGPDWRNNPATQITWGLGYVKSRYGTPCSAWGFKSSHGWY